MDARLLRLGLTTLGLLFVGLTAWSLRYFSQYQPLSTLTGSGGGGLGQFSLQAGEVRVIGHGGGRRRWRMSADRVTFSRDRRTLTADGIGQALLYDAARQPVVSLSAGHAAYQTPFGALSLTSPATLTLSGNVRAALLRPEHPVLQTQTLIWDSQAGRLTCPGGVSATLPKLSVSAGTALYDLPPGPAADRARGTLRLSGGIRAVVAGPHGQAELSCPGLTWDGAQNRAASLGLVSARLPGGLGAATASDVSVDTRTGDLTTHGLRGTMLLSTEVQ